MSIPMDVSRGRLAKSSRQHIRAASRVWVERRNGPVYIIGFEAADGRFGYGVDGRGWVQIYADAAAAWRSIERARSAGSDR